MVAELKDLFHHVEAQAAVAFELGLIEPLVAGGLVRKRGVLGRVIQHVLGLIAGERRLDVDQVSILRAWPVHRAIGDPAAGAMLGFRRDLFRHGDAVGEFNRDAQVDANLSSGVAQVVEVEGRVRRSIHHDDGGASPQHHLVEAQILKMTAVGEVHPRILVAGQPKRLVDERPDGKGRTRLGPEPSARLARVGAPDAQARIEQHHNDAQERRGSVAHIGVGCRAGNGDGAAEGNLVAVQPRFLVSQPAAPGAVFRRCEGLRFALLPRQVFALDQVQRRVHNVQRPGGQIGHAHVVAGVEPGERVRFPPAVGRSQKRPDQPHAIHGVQRKLVGIDEPGENQGGDGQQRRQQEFHQRGTGLLDGGEGAPGRRILYPRRELLAGPLIESSDQPDQEQQEHRHDELWSEP